MNREKINARKRELYSIDPDRYKGHSLKWRRIKANNDKVIINTRTWFANNIEKTKKWKLENKHKLAKYRADRRARELKATPEWANQFFIEEIYDLAKIRSCLFGIKLHVDHVIPLKNKVVCGLHVEHNLQIIAASANHKKINSYRMIDGV